MNGLPATIVIRHLMATPTHPATTRRPARVGRPAEKVSRSRRMVLRIAASTVLVAAALGLVLVLAVRTTGTA